MSAVHRSRLLPDEMRASRRPRIGETDSGEAVKPAVRWAFYAFVFSILFEAAPVGVPVELTKLTGGALILASLLQPHICFRFPPAAVWCFVAYFNIAVVTLILQGGIHDGTGSRLFVLAQLIFLFWISHNLMRHDRVAREAVLALAASCVVLAALRLLGLTTTTVEAQGRSSRLSVFGLDPNQLAGFLAVGMIALIGLAYGVEKSLLRPRFLAWPLVALVAVPFVQTSSRGGLLALAAGLAISVLRRGDLSSRLRTLLIVLIGMGFFGWVTLRSDTLRRRFETTVQTGNLTGRELIYPAAWQMFREKPLLGWGPMRNSVELGDRLRLPHYERMDPHNLVLYVLTATGLVGAIPFFAGVGLCVRAAWRARHGNQGILPLALVTCLLVADMSVTGLHWKQHWLILAYALASGHPITVAPITQALARARSSAPYRRAEVTR